MSRYFKEVGTALRGRKHLFFLVLLLSVMSLSLLAFGKGLKKSVDEAFGVQNLTESRFGCSITHDDQVYNQTNLEYRMKLNAALKANTKFHYLAYFDSTAIIGDLKNTALAIDADKYDEVSEDVKKEYTIKVLLVDESIVSYLEGQADNISDEEVKAGCQEFVKAAKRLFAKDLDYDAPKPAAFGANWNREDPSREIKLNVGRGSKKDYIKNVQLEKIAQFKTGTKIMLDGKVFELDDYIVYPLLDKKAAKSTSEHATDTDRFAYWCKIYDIKNDGFFVTTMTANYLQKETNEILEDLGLAKEYKIKISGANNDNIFLFRKDVNDIVRGLGTASTAAVIISAFLLMIYVIFSIGHNRKYSYISYVVGTGKVEFYMVCVFQIILWAVLSTALGYLVYYGICKFTGVVSAGVFKFMVPVIIITLTCMVAGLVRIILWDIGKMTRRQ